MKHFAEFINAVDTTNKTTNKINALVQSFEEADERDKLWLIALFTGKRPKRPVKTSLLKAWCMEITQLPEWLFLESYSRVGDLGETISLLLPEPEHTIEKPLYQWMNEIKQLYRASEEEKKAYVCEAWNGLTQQERFIFNKLIGGSFRVGISKKTLVNGLSKYSGIEPNQLMHSIMGKWEMGGISFQDLISGKHINYDDSKLYPFCLAYPLDKEPEALGSPSEWQVEYKWDGIRGQIVRRNGKIFIWSRGEELVTPQFPELVDVLSEIPYDFVIDGEILPLKDGNVLLFNDLQKRLNRKNVSPKLLKEVPIGFYVYDCMEFEGKDIREQPLSYRREILEKIITPHINQTLQLSTILEFSDWEKLSELQQDARLLNSEGLMLKHLHSPYHTGRKKGDWWKWKVEPLTIDAVLTYAQRGSGRRSGYYTDYTFAVRNGDALVNIAKAYSGLTDEEIKEVSRFVRNNAIEKFGPVRTVKPELVFEIAFEGIALSNRHKSGVALRFPRIKRWRKDKTIQDIDTIETVKSLIFTE
ncbi:ATP-dependent DNA ligase [Riemerella columbina]|uniref:ATP-dependent DNA ligase n=1 Tax=Riemerella columbina TaxID=103810 RepID=UPI000365F3B6|nr:ATP-dependent DNA ligase [Riemerella columbina]